jgi:hypothetical protein
MVVGIVVGALERAVLVLKLTVALAAIGASVLVTELDKVVVVENQG